MSQNELTTLQQENEHLKRQLETCIRWMRKEVEQSVHKIAKRKVTQMTETGREDFLRENQEVIMTKRIQDYFGDLLLLNAPRESIEYLINAEINFYNLGKNPTLDGFSVVSLYHKIFDVLVEQMVTNQFRKFALKQGATILRVNDPLEKALHLVITKKYILSLGRLYGLLKMIRDNDPLHDFGKVFRAYLEKYPSLKELLLGDEFFRLFEKVIVSEIFGAKRHQGSMTLEETKNALKCITGEFSDQNGLLYKMLESLAVTH